MTNQFAIMRFAKYKGPEISRIEGHNERTKETYASNPDIDPTRTHLNFHLIEPTNRYRAEAERQIAAAHCRTRTDSVRLVETLITCSPEFFKDKSQQEIRAYFQHALDFLMEKQRPDTFVSAVVHLDEKTPHMHVTFVPLTQDGRLSAKDIIGNRKHLIAWQDAYWQHMVSKFPELQRGESASNTGRTHIPPQVFKQMVRLTKKRQKIETVLDSINMFNGKAKAEEVSKLLDGYIPDMEKMATLLKKYGVAFENIHDLEETNAELTRELDEAKRGSVSEKLKHYKLQQEYREARAILDRIPPDLLNQLRKENRAVQRDVPEDLRH